MTPDEMRTKYRSNCEYARKGHVIYLANNGKRGEVHKTFTRTAKVGKEKVTLPAINAAKRWVRENAPFKTFIVQEQPSSLNKIRSMPSLATEWAKEFIRSAKAGLMFLRSEIVSQRKRL